MTESLLLPSTFKKPRSLQWEDKSTEHIWVTFGLWMRILKTIQSCEVFFFLTGGLSLRHSCRVARWEEGGKELVIFLFLGSTDEFMQHFGDA